MLNNLALTPEYSLIELKVPAGMVKKKVRDSEKYEVVVLLILRGSDLILSPDVETVMETGDILVVVGDKTRLTEFSAL